MNETAEGTDIFVETREYLRFAEFCDACPDYRYIGLCHGPPGVGKTLSARRYAGAESSEFPAAPQDSGGAWPAEASGRKSVFYTVPVINTPGIIERGIAACRQQLHELLYWSLSAGSMRPPSTRSAQRSGRKRKLGRKNFSGTIGLPARLPNGHCRRGPLKNF